MITIYSKPDCGACASTKQLLNSRGKTFDEKVLNTHFTRESLLEMYPTARSFPVVVIDGYYIGGYSELVKQLNEAALDSTQLLTE